MYKTVQFEYDAKANNITKMIEFNGGKVLQFYLQEGRVVWLGWTVEWLRSQRKQWRAINNSFLLMIERLK